MRRAIWFVALTLFAQDPAGTLEQTRDHVLPKLKRLPMLTCVETIGRRYFSREDQPGPAPACENIVLDRKKARKPPKFQKSDRLRLAVTIAEGREIYSWTGAQPASYSVEDILHPGPIGTGAFANHLLYILTNPAVEFGVLEDGATSLENGFRVPIEASHYLVRAGDNWNPTGYSGSFRIRRASQCIDQFALETNELPRETSLCETTSVLEYGEDTRWFLPQAATIHDVMRDASETDSAITLSDCWESAAVAPQPLPAPGAPIPAGVLLSLTFHTPFDSDGNAAGDAISATISDARLREFEGRPAHVALGRHRPWTTHACGTSENHLRVCGGAGDRNGAGIGFAVLRQTHPRDSIRDVSRTREKHQSAPDRSRPQRLECHVPVRLARITLCFSRAIRLEMDHARGRQHELVLAEREARPFCTGNDCQSCWCRSRRTHPANPQPSRPLHSSAQPHRRASPATSERTRPDGVNDESPS